MVSQNKHWIDILKDKYMLWLFRILITVLFIVVCANTFFYFKDASAGKHAKLLWGLGERNIPKGYPDTVYKNVFIHDTSYIDRVVFSKPTPTKKAGTSIRDIHAKNAAVGDNNKVGDTYYEKTISEEDMAAIVDFMEQEKKKVGLTSKCFRIDIMMGVNNNNAAYLLKDYLIKRGYEFKEFVNIVARESFKGAQVIVGSDCVSIRIGTL